MTTGTPLKIGTNLKIGTWNINSVRLRFEQVARVLAEHRPDVLCLQETKCPDELFPAKGFAALGYAHQAISGMKGYNGVAILSRLPIEARAQTSFCEKQDCRHIAATVRGVTVHNVYLPAGGDVADPAVNVKFAHKLAFLDHLTRFSADLAASGGSHVLVGDLNVAPLEFDVWSHKQLLDVVSHTPVETNALNGALAAGDWIDAIRLRQPEPERVFTWWSYRNADWTVSDRGRRLDHVWLSRDLGPQLTDTQIVRETRSWDRPSDHVPVFATLTL